VGGARTSPDLAVETDFCGLPGVLAGIVISDTGRFEGSYV